MFDTGKKNGNNLQNSTEKCSKTAFYLRENGQFSSESQVLLLSQNIFLTQTNQFEQVLILKNSMVLRLEIT